MDESRIVFIAGPTASGKSAAALRLAEETGGVIVNADAMQIYADLKIVTARPDEADERRAPHRLYGAIDASEACSAGRWAGMAAREIGDILNAGRIAILTGGTGLYFKALEDGLSPIPETPPEIRAAARARRDALGAEAFRDEVLERDPGMTHLPAGDAQRLMRAWEVHETTGKPLSHFQHLPRTPFIDGPIRKAVIAPPRARLYASIDQRAHDIFSDAGIAEVRALLLRDVDLQAPVMKALGVPEIAAFLAGEMSREEALAALQQNTRRFAKRQMTWFRNQASGWPSHESAEAALAALAS